MSLNIADMRIGDRDVAIASGAAHSDPQPPSALIQTDPLDPYVAKRPQVETKIALHGYQPACEADRQALCTVKRGPAGDLCLVYHRLGLSTPFKQAMDSLILAQSGPLKRLHIAA